MLRIVLKRCGRKGIHFFHLIVRETKNNKIIDKVGYYNADNKTDIKNNKFVLFMDKINYWLSKGAQSTPLIKNIILAKKNINK
ncbi:30S ribosomal protein S16 [Rickettsiales bacterium (ex Bugula neritina AB1)]|nr:30S ribosomal protein S16 [Rickettsiales bacterium (ex Bugula neritina AB1)]